MVSYVEQNQARMPPMKTNTTQNKTICMPCTTEKYEQIIDNPPEFRSYLDHVIKLYPELFPVTITAGYQLKDSRYSKKLGLRIRRIETRDDQSWSVRPSFVTPYLSGYVSEVEKPLFFRKFTVPFWALAYAFGRDAMYWYRLECALGRNSLVGTTVKSAEALPKDLVADEKHTKQGGQKVYIAVTVGMGCILGAEITLSLMKFMDRWLFASQYFHGTTDAARLQTRGWVLLENFCPSTPLTIKKYHGKISPAERLNGFRYHDNWLQNLLISASMGGTQHDPQKTL